MQELVTYLNAFKHSDLSESTKHPHRKVLQMLLESIAQDVNAKIKVIHEPKRLEDYGAPNFKITQLDMIIGYVENKKIGEKLDAILKPEPMKIIKLFI
jgi:hypothetical protein